MTDRELDALVANSVMGLSNVRVQEQGYHTDLVYGPNVMAGVAQLVPHYSTDIAAAWQVVEKTNLLFKYDLRRRDDGMWELGHYYYEDFVTKAEAETAPKAICLMALVIGGIEVK
jgi:hypothetical protein